MKRLATFCVLLAIAAAAHGQEPFTLSIEVRVINVDVVVTDRSGKPLENLTKDNFRLLIDGRPVEIKYFSRVVEGRLDNQDVAAAAEAPAAQPAVAAPRTPVTWAIFLDQTNVRPAQRNASLRQLRSFLETAFDPADRVVIGSFDGAAIRIRRGFADRQQLLDTLTQMERERVQSGPAMQARSRIRMEMNSLDRSDPQFGFMLEELGQQIATVMEMEADRTRRAIQAMGNLIDVLKGAEGRLAVVYVGAGFTTLPALDLIDTYRQRFPEVEADMRKPRPELHQAHLDREVHRLFDRIAATRAAIYTIYAGDPSASALNPEDQGNLVTTGGIAGDRATMTEISLAREISDRTGGLFFKNNPELARQLQAVQTDLTHYYSLGYQPEGPIGKSGKVRVEVNVPGARVRYREEVRERTQEEQAADSVVAALFDPRESNALNVTVETGAPKSAKKPKLVPVRVKVPLDSLTFLPEGDAHRAGLIFHFAVAAEDGTVWRLESRELPLRIPRAQLAKALTQKITYSVDVPLQRRGARLAVSVQDRIGQTRSLVTVPLEPEIKPAARRER